MHRDAAPNGLRGAARTATRTLLALVAIAVAAASLAATPAVADSATPTPSPTSGSDRAADPNRVTFGIQPASRGKDGVVVPDQRPYLYYTGAPGSTIQDHVAVINYGLTPITATVYSTDARNDAQGGFTLLTGQEKSTDAGAWTSLSVKRVTATIAARSTRTDLQQTFGVAILPMTITIPVDATPGDHVGGILVSVVTSKPDARGANVQLDQRVGTRMFVRVAGELTPRIEIEDLSASYDGTANPVGTGSAVVTFTVANRGNVKLGGRMKVEVSGLLGRTASIDLPDLQLLLPGNSVTVTGRVPEVVPQLRNTATVTLTPLKLSADSDPALPDVVASTSFLAIPWALIAVVVALILLGVLAWRRSRRGSPVAGVAVDDTSSPESIPVP